MQGTQGSTVSSDLMTSCLDSNGQPLSKAAEGAAWPEEYISSNDSLG